MGRSLGGNKELTRIFDSLVGEYFISTSEIHNYQDNETEKEQHELEKFDKANEEALVSNFLATPCPCGKNCQTRFTMEELLKARVDHRILSRGEKNCTMLALLKSFQRSSRQTMSARSSHTRLMQKFDYRINAD